MVDQMECRCIDFMGEEFEEAMKLRTLVLRKPLNMEYLPEDIAAEYDSHHLAGFQEGKMIAYLILKPLANGITKMRQVAVDPTFQGQGMGKRLVAYSELFARQHGIKKIELHARMTAVPFYINSGYTIVGEEFLEVGLPHLKMEKNLG